MKAVAVCLALALSVSISSPVEACDGKSCEQGAPAAADPVKVEVPRSAPSLGSPQAKVTLVVFSDFQCPFCARGAQTVAKLREKYGDKVRVVFRHQPLPFHDRAQAAAEAAMAAHEQGRFWEYHDALFARPGALDDATLEGHAATLKLDLVKFRASRANHAASAALSADAAEASRLDVQGTPTFFVNGRRVVGAQPYEVFTQLIDGELKR